MKSPLIATLIAPVLFLALAACPGPVRVVQPPPERLTCEAEPPALAPPITDADDVQYKLALRAAWFDCHNAVGWLRDWFGELPE